MKLNLNSPRKTSSTGGASSNKPPEGALLSRPRSASPSQPASSLAPDPRAGHYGRSCAPPAPGSTYWEFLHWASEGAMALDEDTDLAIRLWSGMTSTEENSSPSMGMR
jgi:hypothetical protein